LAEGWSITALEIDVDGKKAWMSLSKDGEEVSNKVVKEYGSDNAAGTGYFVYEDDLGANDNSEVMNFTVETVFAGMNTNLVKVNDIDLISVDVLEIKSSTADVVEDYDVTKMTNQTITVTNANDISLTEDGVVEIMDDRFAIRVTDGKSMAGLGKIVIIEGDGTPTATKTATPTPTVTQVGTEPGDGTEPGTATPTATATEVVPTPTPTKEPGFEAVFAVAGLLAVAYLVLRQRD
ncbi:MAG: PGF-CTERM sorting domain-containing protein, partial [ANME-2 cluster archaeon]|nr:PGF-CTERM sorting domain-containing protein [ANME-2 cluster archaeon]